jgi:hypothetical protein
MAGSLGDVAGAGHPFGRDPHQQLARHAVAGAELVGPVRAM